jgi:hypothetical protein
LPDTISSAKKILNNNDIFYGIIDFLSVAYDDHSAVMCLLKHSPPEAAHVPLHVLLCVFVI